MLDHSDEYLIWDYVEAITVIRVRPISGNESTEVAKAHKHDVLRGEQEPSHGVYVGDTVLWLVPAALHPERIKPRDEIHDATGKVYIVLNVTEPALNDCWDCNCLDLTIWSELTTQVQLFQATVTLDNTGSRSIAYGNPTTISAHIQPDESSKETINGRRQIYRRALLFSLADLPLALNDRIRDADANDWQVTRVSDEQRIDAFQVVELELR